MSDLLVLVPSRGRPENAKRLFDVCEASSAAWVTFVVDENDPEKSTYLNMFQGSMVVAPPGGRPGIVDPLNWAASLFTQNPWHWDYIGFMGDDHLPQTPDWDERIISALEQMGTGIVYGNDLLMGEELPTAAFMTSDIVRTLGYMAPPQLNHLFVDNFWLELGKGIDRIKYLDDVIIEHIHPLNGKAEWDATYSHCNDNAAPKDGFIWQALIKGGYIQAAIDKVKATL